VGRRHPGTVPPPVGAAAPPITGPLPQPPASSGRRGYLPSEASFAQLAGAPLRSRKSSWAGVTLRRQFLARAGICLPDDLGPAGDQAAPDDVLNAAGAAWTARASFGTRGGQAPPPELALASALAPHSRQLPVWYYSRSSLLLTWPGGGAVGAPRDFAHPGASFTGA
jgi:Protein of unknown function (DUF429)